jgi:predicted nucleotidyltransferase
MIMYLTSHIPQIKELCEQHKVDKLYAFGSVLTDQFNENSDVDFSCTFKDDIPLLEYGDNYFDFKFSLEDMLNRKVDLLEEKALKNRFFIYELNRTKQQIYG